MSEQETKTPMPVSLEPDPVIEVYKKDVDRTLLQENLKLTVEERFRNLMRLQRFADEATALAQRILLKGFLPRRHERAGYLSLGS
jgi:hypothetical protein